MRNHYRVFALAAPVLAASTAFGNILVNPGFETGALAPWFQAVDFGGPEDWNVTGADAFTGSFSATDRGNKLIKQSFTAVATSDITSLTFALKNLDASINAVYFEYSDSSTEENLISHSDALWHVYDYTSFLDAGKSLVAFGVYGVSGGSTERTYLDDASIEVVPEPATMAVLGLGAAALIRRRRRA